MFTIIDIETCGGKFDYQKGRIIEICVLLHDGLTVVDKLSTIINPECYISPYFSKISGITNEMVQDAPKFYEIANDLIAITEGQIFVAHNVNFDYRFIQEEFASLGYKFRRDTLCTVRMSRKLIPGKKSYSLGKLCASLDIEIEDRHRAEGDAVATAKLFDLLMQVKSTHPVYKKGGLEKLMSKRVDSIKKYILEKLPDAAGVYYFLNREGDIIYIGKSKNMYERAKSHFAPTTQKGKKMLHEIQNVDFVKTGSELIALLHEADEIKKHQPLFNRSRKAEAFSHCIVSYQKDGIVRFRIEESDKATEPLAFFHTYSSARAMLEQWIEKYELCLTMCGLVSDEAVCFHHQLKKCKGICANKEEKAAYNKRAREAKKGYAYPKNNFYFLDKGRSATEYSVIVVKQGKLHGFAYFDETESIQSVEEMMDALTVVDYTPDNDTITKGWLRQKKIKLFPF